jgi:hypothetical protein
MTTLEQAARQALDALKATQSCAAEMRCGLRICDEAIAALESALAQQAEPVGWMHKETGLLRRETNSPKGSDWDANYWLPLYSTTAPQQQAEPVVEQMNINQG